MEIFSGEFIKAQVQEVRQANRFQQRAPEAGNGATAPR